MGEHAEQHSLTFTPPASELRAVCTTPFLLAGILTFGMLWLFAEWAFWSALLIATLPLLVGIGIVLNSRNILIRSEERQVVERTAIIAWFFVREHIYAFDDFTAVKVKRIESRGGVSSFQLCLAFDGLRDLCLMQAGRHKVRTAAEELSRVMGLGIYDHSTGVLDLNAALDGVVPELPPDAVVPTSREVGERRGEDRELPPMPGATRIACRPVSGALQICIPASGPRFWNVFWLALFVFMVVYPLGGLLSSGEGPRKPLSLWWTLFAIAAGAGYLAFAFWFAGLPALRSMTRRFTIDVTPSGMSIHEKAFLRNRTCEISGNELLEFKMAEAAAFDHQDGGGAVLARSASESVVFGQGLSDEELRWLKAVIETVLTATPR